MSSDGVVIVGRFVGSTSGTAVYQRSGHAGYVLLCQALDAAPGECRRPHVLAPLRMSAELEGAAPSITLDGAHHTLSPTTAAPEVIAVWTDARPFAAWARRVSDASVAIGVATDAETLRPVLEAAGQPPPRLAAALAAYAHMARMECAPTETRSCGSAEVRAVLARAVDATASSDWAETPPSALSYPWIPDRPAGLYRLDPVLPGLARTAWLEIEGQRGSAQDGSAHHGHMLSVLTTSGPEEGGESLRFEGALTEVELPGGRSLRFAELGGAIHVRLLGEGWRDGCGDGPCPSEAFVTRVDALETLGNDVWLGDELAEAPRPSATTTTARLFDVVRVAAAAAGLDPGSFSREIARWRFGEAYRAILEVCGALPYRDEPLDAVGERGVCAEGELREVVRDTFLVSSAGLTLAQYRERWGARSRAALAHRVEVEEAFGDEELGGDDPDSAEDE